MMNTLPDKLSDLALDRRYDPAVSGNLVKVFYEPCLSCSVKYDRLSAYFTSESLKASAAGLHKLVRNGGRIRFIFSNRIEASELDAIEEAYKNRKLDNLAESIDVAAFSNDFEVANLGFLIEAGLAEVKIVFMVQDEALCHQKLGIFEDAYGNAVYFEGSGNETASGLTRNSETFTVFKSWDERDLEQDVNPGKDRFEKIWNNTYSPSKMVACEPTDAMYQKLRALSQGRFFENENEFFAAKECVLLDVDEGGDEILLSDFTKQHLLSIAGILASRFSGRWKRERDDFYSICQLNIKTIKAIDDYLKSYHIPLEMTDTALSFFEENNLQLEKRQKLAIAIKQRTETEVWESDYLNFQRVVNSETTARLKPNQMLNAFYHTSLLSSADYSVPGTGKTYIAYGMYAYLTAKSKIDSLVVLGPLNCFMAWKEEGSAIFRGKRNLTFYDVSGYAGRERLFNLAKRKYNVYLINYEALDRSDELARVLSEHVLTSKTMVVFDESHRLKNPTGKRATAVLQMLEEARSKPIYRLSMTGTPLPNSFRDIYNQIRLLYPQDHYILFPHIDPSTLKLADGDFNTDIKRTIEEELYPTFVRITKEDLEVPKADPDDKETLSVLPTDDEDKLYKLLKRRYFKNPLSLFIRMIQATSNPSLLCKALDFNELLNDIYDEDEAPPEFKDADDDVWRDEEIKALVEDIPMASKTAEALSLIENLVAEGKKVIVWCLFVDSIDMVVRNLRKRGIQTESICGRDNPEVRTDKIRDFKNGETMVLVTNPNTLAESVSLHKTCHDAVYLEYGFNLTYMLQSKDRIHRVGLPEGTRTHYYYAITEKTEPSYGSIDTSILDRLDKKAKRMYGAIENDELAVIDESPESIDDIQEILRASYGN